MRPTTLSNDELVARLDVIRANERRRTIEMIVHLAELDRREFYLELGYASLFDFCVRRLRYSEAAASRRIRTARCVRRCPAVLIALQRGDVTLSTISAVASILTEANGEALLVAIRGKSRREVDAVVAMWRPEGNPVRDRIRPVCVRRGAGAVADAAASVGPGARAGAVVPARSDATGTIAATAGDAPKVYREDHRRGDETAPLFAAVTSAVNPAVNAAPTARCTAAEPAGTDVTAGALGGVTSSVTTESARTVATEMHFEFRFGADTAFKKKFDRVRELMATRFLREDDIAGVIEILMDAYIDRHCPHKKAERRAKRKQRAQREGANEQDRRARGRGTRAPDADTAQVTGA